VIGMAEHVASADQKYRLFGMGMFMSQEAARKLKVGMDALGASLEEIAWDPELNGNFLKLADLQDRLAKGLGPKFEGNMRDIRDMAQKFRELRIELEYLSYGFISRLFEKMGTSIGQVGDKVQQLIGWIQSDRNFKKVTDWLADQFVPILKTTWEIVKELGIALGQTATVFTNLIGLFSGDSSIEGTEFSFEKLAGAIQHVVGWVAEMVLTFTHAEEMLLHFVDAVLLALSGNFVAAALEVKKGLNLLTPGTGAVVGGTAGAIGGGALGVAVLIAELSANRSGLFAN
jgi:hypothetical protein